MYLDQTIEQSTIYYIGNNVVGSIGGLYIGNTLVTLNPSTNPGLPIIEYLVVGGGGAGGNGAGGGGGAGGLLSGSFLSSVQSYPVTVGAGGAKNTTSGQRGNSGTLSSVHVYSANGGGGGAGITLQADTGGSGGGASYARTFANGTAGQGNAGGDAIFVVSPQVLNGGGGGGAGAVGSNGVNVVNSGGDGGIGLQSAINGTLTYYAGGGGACRSKSGNTVGAPGGLGGGGNGGSDGSSPNSPNVTPGAGAPNTGGGGGGSAWGNSQFGEAGGSGVVILRYLQSAMTATGGTITTDGAYKVHTFTSDGTFARTS